MVVPVELGDGRIELTTAIFDVNGTLTVHGALLDGVAERIGRLRDGIEVILLSADTFGTVDSIADELGVSARRARDAADKAACLREIGAGGAVGIGNGNNDRLLLRDAALGIAVIGPEGLAAALLPVADVVCGSIVDALDLLLDPPRLTATLRP